MLNTPYPKNSAIMTRKMTNWGKVYGTFMYEGAFPFSGVIPSRITYTFLGKDQHIYK